MNLFRKTPALDAPEISGTEAIRLRVWSRWKKANLSRMATDHKLSLGALEAFATGTGKLPEAALHALCKEFFMNARFDPVADRLIDTSPPPQPAGVIPEPYDLRSNPNFVPIDPNRHYVLRPPGNRIQMRADCRSGPVSRNAQVLPRM
jgi:hypothetical protein